MTLPTFLVAGVPKAATTSIYRYLQQHPQVYMSPVKEPRFFIVEGMSSPESWFRWAPELVTNARAYEALFSGVKHEIAIGEASVGYFRSEQAALNIFRLIPAAKILVSLRHPVDRAFSQFAHALRDGHETCRDFRTAFHRDLHDAPPTASGPRPLALRYSSYSFYADSMQRYTDLFGRSQVQVVLYDDLARDPVGTMGEIYGFIGVDDRFVPDVSVRYNASGLPKSRLLHKALRPETRFARAMKRALPKEWLSKVRARVVGKNLQRLQLDPDLRSELTEVYRDDLLRVERLTGLDLSRWHGPA